jgi:hypothetical protein
MIVHGQTPQDVEKLQRTARARARAQTLRPKPGDAQELRDGGKR